MAKATQIVHWPGQDVPACDDHVQQLKNVAGVMGFNVSCTPVYVDTVCTNCENREKKEVKE